MSHVVKSARCLVVAVASVVAAVIGPASADPIQFWTTEEQPDRLATQQEMARSFEDQSGIRVELVPVSESDLGTRVMAAFAADALPDVIYHSLQFALPWMEAGLLDADAASEVIASLGEETFARRPLSLVAVDGGVAAVPVDGWAQMIFYRKDLFAEKRLAPPDSYASIEAAIDALHAPPEMYGFVAPTKVDETVMSQVLEHVFLANGVSPVGATGIDALDVTATTEALAFYKALKAASPEGELYWKQSRDLYLAGQAAMVIWSPFLLDELAGLQDSAPSLITADPTSAELARRTGIVASFAGPSKPDGAAWGNVSYLGITRTADRGAATAFVTYALDAGYVEMLRMAPEGKFPVRKGTAQDPDKFMRAWAELPVGVDRHAPLGDLYDPQVMAELVAGLDAAQRWGVQEGQLALASKVVNSQIINRAVRQYIDGDMDAVAAITVMNDELSKLE